MSDRKGHRTLWQVLGLYAAASWICLQVVDILAENIPLPSWVFMLTLILLLIGLPITAATAYLNTRRAQASEDKEEGSGFAHQLLTWQNVLRGGIAAMAIWGVAVTGWLSCDASFVSCPVVSRCDLPSCFRLEPC